MSVNKINGKKSIPQVTKIVANNRVATVKEVNKVVDDIETTLLALQEETSGDLQILATAIDEVADDLQTLSTNVSGIKPYSTYVVNVTQATTANPIANILENSLSGIPTWTRTGVGIATCVLSGAFVIDKTWINLTMPVASQNDEYFARLEKTNVNTLTLLVTNLAGTPMDEYIFDLEIRVYN